MCKICVLCEKLWRKQHHLRIDVLYIRSIWNEQRIQWVQLDRLKEAFKCNDTYLHLHCISRASLIRVTDTHLKFECNILFENSTNIRNWILFLTALLSTSLLHHLQGPLDFRSTSPLQPIILHPWPVCLLSAKPLCRDFLPGSLIVTQILPVVFYSKTLSAFTFQREAVRELFLIGSENPDVRWLAAVPEETVK